jgi:hypothetical protein
LHLPTLACVGMRMTGSTEVHTHHKVVHRYTQRRRATTNAEEEEEEEEEISREQSESYQSGSWANCDRASCGCCDAERPSAWTESATAVEIDVRGKNVDESEERFVDYAFVSAKRSADVWTK